jgi:acyl-CoA reductase-like NAD-dependent aldehyde dehydrogenase
MAIEQTAAGTSAGKAEITTLKMVIGGETLDAAEGKTFEIVNPATGKVIATAPLGGKEDVDRAVKAAQDAFDAPKGWSSFAAGKRGRTLG